VPSLLAEVLAREIKAQLLDQSRSTKPLRLTPPDRSPAPRPEPIGKVPRRFRELIGDHSPHPGTGRGHAALRRAPSFVRESACSSHGEIGASGGAASTRSSCFSQEEDRPYGAEELALDPLRVHDDLTGLAVHDEARRRRPARLELEPPNRLQRETLASNHEILTFNSGGTTSTCLDARGAARTRSRIRMPPVLPPQRCRWLRTLELPGRTQAPPEHRPPPPPGTHRQQSNRPVPFDHRPGIRTRCQRPHRRTFLAAQARTFPWTCSSRLLRAPGRTRLRAERP